uniref:Uncharacterized protein n=1 Tax=Amphilophus citrinellus TaxID=61819 RepID=A0A3Q0R8Z7_AMPCI
GPQEKRAPLLLGADPFLSLFFCTVIGCMNTARFHVCLCSSRSTGLHKVVKITFIKRATLKFSVQFIKFHPSSSTYPVPGHRGSSPHRETQTSSPATFSSLSDGTSRCSQASREI